MFSFVCLLVSLFYFLWGPFFLQYSYIGKLKLTNLITLISKKQWNPWRSVLTTNTTTWKNFKIFFLINNPACYSRGEKPNLYTKVSLLSFYLARVPCYKIKYSTRFYFVSLVWLFNGTYIYVWLLIQIALGTQNSWSIWKAQLLSFNIS